MRRLLLFLCLLLSVVQTSAWFLKKKNWYVTARGCVRCYNAPMKKVKIFLMDDDPIFDDKMASGRTDRNGCFRITGKGRDFLRGKPDPFIKVEYQYSGTYGKMEVEKIFGINRKGNSRKKRYARYVNFGVINFKSVHCKAYTSFYKALVDYRSRARRSLPYKELHVRTGVIIHGGTPYATTDKVRIPRKYSPSRLGFSTAKHELAHTIRHSMDGSFLHFLRDVVKFGYMRSHHCGTRSNYGYAFNEGWAEYWANTCYGSYGSLTDYKIEGNVAKALRRLRSTCNSNDRKFVNILKYNRKKIHSFREFNRKHKATYNCGL